MNDIKEWVKRNFWDSYLTSHDARSLFISILKLFSVRSGTLYFEISKFFCILFFCVFTFSSLLVWENLVVFRSYEGFSVTKFWKKSPFFQFRTWQRKEQHFQKSVSKSHALISLTLLSYSTTIILFKKLTLSHLTIKYLFYLIFVFKILRSGPDGEYFFLQIKKTSSVSIGIILFFL